MELVTLACRLAVAVVLAVAAVAKLADREGTSEALTEFGVPLRLVTVIALLLAPTELAVVVLLVPGTTGQLGAAVALVLLLAFTVVVAANLLAGRRPICNCFGRFGASDVSARTLARNTVLMTAALVGLLGPTVGPLRALSSDPQGGSLAILAGALGAAVLLAAESTARSRAQRQVDVTSEADVSRALDDGLEDRGQAPDLPLVDLAGTSVRTGELWSDRPVLFVSLRPGCGSCRVLTPSVGRWMTEFADRLAVVAITTEDSTSSHEAFGSFDRPSVLDPDGALRQAIGTVGNPTAALVDTHGRIRGPVASGIPAIRALMGAGLGVYLADGNRPPPVLTPISVLVASSTVVLSEMTADGGLVTALTDEVTGASLSLDVLSRIVWECFDGAGTIAEISADLAAVFEADEATVQTDVLTLAKAFVDDGYLELAERSVASAGS